MTPQEARRAPLLPAVAAAGLALALGMLFLLATGQDDAYITYWAAHSLATSGELLNYAGERVEQSSSLLHTLALALLAFVARLELPAIGYWFSIAAGLLATLRAAVLCRPLGLAPSPLLMAWIATVPAFLYWWFSGLETTLHTWLMVEVAIVGARAVSDEDPPSLVPAALASAAFVAVRPESIFVLASAVVGWIALSLLLHRRVADEMRGRRRLMLWLAAGASVFAAITVFRLFYFGLAFPQPVYAKTGGSLTASLVSGFGYLAKLATQPTALPVAVAVAALPVLLWWERGSGPAERAARYVLLLIAAQVAFVVCVGGDWMLGGRFFAPMAPLAVVAVARGSLRLGVARARLRTIAWAALPLQLAGILALSMAGTGEPLWRFLAQERGTIPALHWSERANRAHRRDLAFVDGTSQAIGALRVAGGRVTLLSRQAGMVMFHIALRHEGHIEFVDLHGLTSRHLQALRAERQISPGEVGLLANMDDWLETGSHPVPDLIFDVWPTAADAARHGYRVVYQQTGVAAGWQLGRLSAPLRRDYSLYQYLAAGPEAWSRLPRSLRGSERDVSQLP